MHSLPALTRAQIKTFLGRFGIFFVPAGAGVVTARLTSNGPLSVLAAGLALAGMLTLFIFSLPDIIRTVSPGFSGSLRSAQDWLYDNPGTDARAVRRAGDWGLYLGILGGLVLICRPF